MAQTSGINRGLMWLRKVLQVTEETESPSVLSEIVQPSMDVFGWDRLENPEFDTSGVAAPTIVVNGPITPEGVIRLVLHASVVHTDSTLSHFLWIDKQREVTTELVGVSNPINEVPADVDIGLDRWVWVEPGSRLRGRAAVALGNGALVLDITFVDLPIGEYIL